MRIKAILKAINSKMDRNGNTYWAFSFTDCKTGKTVNATICGGESNIYAIIRHWNVKLNDWDRSIHFEREELPIREFNRLTKNWQYAGCNSQELAQFIKKSLK